MPSGLTPGFKLAGRQTVRAEQQMTSDMQLSMSERAGGGRGSPSEHEDVGTIIMLEAYHHRMSTEVMGGRKYQAYASDLSSQFICMGPVVVTPRSWS